MAINEIDLRLRDKLNRLNFFMVGSNYLNVAFSMI